MEEEAGRVHALTEPCFAAVDRAPASVALSSKIPMGQFVALSLLGDKTKPTQEEVRLLFERHAALQLCRKLALENVGKIHPAFVGLMADTYAESDERYLKLVKRETTWGDNARAYRDAAQAFGAKMAGLLGQIGQQLASAHAYEMQQRQRAAQALVVWSMYQQQLELQRQAVANANRPVVTNCNYFGRQLQCTSY